MKVEAVEMEALKNEILKGNLNIQNVLQVCMLVLLCNFHQNYLGYIIKSLHKS